MLFEVSLGIRDINPRVIHCHEVLYLSVARSCLQLVEQGKRKTLCYRVLGNTVNLQGYPVRKTVPQLDVLVVLRVL